MQGALTLRVGGFLRVQAADRQQEQDCTRPGHCVMPCHGTTSSTTGPPSSAPRPVVYPRQARGVNRNPGLPVVLLTVLLLTTLLSVSGCVTTPAPPPRYLLAVRYDLQPTPGEQSLESTLLPEQGHAEAEPALNATSPAQGRATFQQDLSTLARLGFPTVVLTNTSDAERLALLNAAQEAGLTAVVGARRAQAQLAQAEVTAQVPWNELKRAWPVQLCTHPAWEAALFDARGNPAQYLQALKWAQQQPPLPFRIVCLGPNVATRDEPGILTIQTTQLDPDRDASLTQQALWRYHAGLRTGRTAGLLFDRYRALPDDSAGAPAAPEPLTPALNAAVQALAERAGRWGPKLFGARARAVSVPHGAYRGVGGAPRTARYGDLAFTEFVRGNRRYLMVFNRALDQHVRGPCVLPALIGEQEVRRAVEIPGSSVRVAGEVVQARGGKLNLRLELRPGDAVLYELF